MVRKKAVPTEKREAKGVLELRSAHLEAGKLDGGGTGCGASKVAPVELPPRGPHRQR